MNSSRRVILSIAGILGAACVSTTLSEPRPHSDLSANGESLTLDLRHSAGLGVDVQGAALELLVLPREDSLIILNKRIADDLKLKPVMWGLGSVSITDGDYRVGGRAFKATYRVKQSPNESAWVLVLDENIHPEYDGAISFGAIPARRLRILLNDPAPNSELEIRNLRLSGKSKALESARDYFSLDFSRTLALYRTSIAVNRKATDYIIRSGAGKKVGAERTIARLFGNVRRHEPLGLDPPIDIDGFQVETVLGEVADREMGVQLSRERNMLEPDARFEDTIVVTHDRKTAQYAPAFYLGRDFFKECSEMHVDKHLFQESDQITVAVHCAIATVE